jgi:translation initiation factor 1
LPHDEQTPTGGLVYSTEAGKMCPGCRRPVAACACKQAAAAPGGPLRVSRESKGRGGKTVTLVKGLPLDAMALAQLGKQLQAPPVVRAAPPKTASSRCRATIASA